MVLPVPGAMSRRGQCCYITLFTVYSGKKYLFLKQDASSTVYKEQVFLRQSLTGRAGLYDDL